MREHTIFKCDDSCNGCAVCLGGLTKCDVCGAAEGCLAPECPGYWLSADQRETQYDEYCTATAEKRPIRNMWACDTAKETTP